MHPFDAFAHVEHRRTGLQRAAERFRLARRAARREPDARPARSHDLTDVARLQPRAIDPDHARSPAA